MKRFRTLGAPYPMTSTQGERVRLSTFIPLKIRKRGVRRVLVRPDDGDPQSAQLQDVHHDSPMQVALSRAFYWQGLLNEGLVCSGTEIAKLEGLHPSTVNELLRLTLLEPGIIQSLMAGRQPRRMSLLWFQRNPLPLDWVEQRWLVAGFDR